MADGDCWEKAEVQGLLRRGGGQIERGFFADVVKPLKVQKRAQSGMR